MLWKGYIDVQFVAESSLALAHYVSGYVTKAERSNMKEIWQEVSENKSIYGRFWSFGIRTLLFRECSLYETSDLLLGDHLTEKSDTVKWTDVSMPHKRNRRLKDHNVLQEIAKTNLDTEEIFQENHSGSRVVCSHTLSHVIVGYQERVCQERHGCKLGGQSSLQ